MICETMAIQIIFFRNRAPADIPEVFAVAEAK